MCVCVCVCVCESVFLLRETDFNIFDHFLMVLVDFWFLFN